MYDEVFWYKFGTHKKSVSETKMLFLLKLPVFYRKRAISPQKRPFSVVPAIGLEPIRLIGSRDFKSLASADSAMRAHTNSSTAKPCGFAVVFGGTTQTRTGGGAFAELCLTTWLWCRQPLLFYQTNEKNATL